MFTFLPLCQKQLSGETFPLGTALLMGPNIGSVLTSLSIAQCLFGHWTMLFPLSMLFYSFLKGKHTPVIVALCWGRKLTFTYTKYKKRFESHLFPISLLGAKLHKCFHLSRDQQRRLFITIPYLLKDILKITRSCRLIFPVLALCNSASVTEGASTYREDISIFGS